MNMQRVILGVLKNLPSPLVRLLAGSPVTIDGYTLDANMQLLGKIAAGAPAPENIEAMRAGVRDMCLSTNEPRRAGVESYDTIWHGDGAPLSVRVYAPTQIADDTAPAILFFHQGGLVLMDVDSDDSFCTVLADECQARVISLEYRLCPEHAFPAAIDDALSLWQYVQDHAAELNIDPKRVAVAGDSAGGLLAANVCLKVKARRTKTQPVAQLLVYPWVSTDLQETGSLVSCAECFPLNSQTMDLFNAMVFPDGKLLNSPLANPLKAKSVKGLPPAIIATAGFDPIRDQGNAYAERLKEAGNDVTHFCFGHLTHSFLIMGNVSKAAQLASAQLARTLATALRD